MAEARTLPMISIDAKAREIKRILENREQNRKAMELAKVHPAMEDLLNDANNAAAKQELIALFSRR